MISANMMIDVITNLMQIFFSLVAGICGSLITKTSNRTMGVIGGFLFGVGFLLEGILGKTLWHLFFFIGVTGKMVTCFFPVPLEYFHFKFVFSFLPKL